MGKGHPKKHGDPEIPRFPNTSSKINQELRHNPGGFPAPQRPEPRFAPARGSSTLLQAGGTGESSRALPRIHGGLSGNAK